MKTIIFGLFLTISSIIYSQNCCPTVKKGGYITLTKVTETYSELGNEIVDTIGRISKVSCADCDKEDALSFKVPVHINLVLYKEISIIDKSKIESTIFNTNCNINYIDSFLVLKEEREETNGYISKKNMLNSADFLIKSAEQRNQSIIIGIIGTVISSAIITSGIKNQSSSVFLGYVIGVGTSVSVLTLQISSNNNQKKAGLALKL